nr:hypothetical protein [uncultured Caproiciproducens sp.]
MMKHVWKISQDGSSYQVPWAASCIGKTGDVYALEGIDRTELDDHDHILKLKIQFGRL